jgi:hypothetical protein
MPATVAPTSAPTGPGGPSTPRPGPVRAPSTTSYDAVDGLSEAGALVVGVGVVVGVLPVIVVPVSPVSLSDPLGEADGLPESVGVGDVVGDGDPVVGVGVGDGDPAEVVGDAVGDTADVVGDAVGDTAEVVGVGVADGDEAAQVEFAVGEADGITLGSSGSARLAAVGPVAPADTVPPPPLAPVPLAPVPLAPVPLAPVPAAQLVDGLGLGLPLGVGVTPPLLLVAPVPPRVSPRRPLGVELAPPLAPLVRLVVGEALPSARPPPPLPPLLDGGAPVSTVLLAAMIAWRKGWTPNETLAMSAIPASTATGRSQLTVSGRPLPPVRFRFGFDMSALGRGSRRSRGNGTLGSCGSRDSEIPAGAGSAAGQAQLQCQAQCPRQVQCLAAATASAA